MSQIDDVLHFIRAAPELPGALCAWQWDLFDNVDDPAAVEQAVGLCRICPVLAQCAEYSSAYGNHDLSGIVAAQVRVWAPKRKQAS